MPLKSAKDKGRRNEHLAVERLRGLGFDAERVFGSGALEKQLGLDFKGDITLTTATDSFCGEVKVRADGFKFLYKAFDQANADFLMLRADRKDWIMVLNMETVERLLGSEPEDE